MNRRWPTILAAACLAVVAGLMAWPNGGTSAQADQGPVLVGFVRNQENLPVAGVHLQLVRGDTGTTVADALSQPDGRFALQIETPLQSPLQLKADREHFMSAAMPVSQTVLEQLSGGQSVELPTITLTRRIGISFWIATAIFILVLVLIAMEGLQNTLAVLVGTTLVFAFSYLGSAIYPDLFIIDFSRALEFIDWNVIFLIMGMMIVIAVVERTGLFQWLGYFAYRVSRGKAWLMVPVLMVTAGVASAFLDNVTTMLLMTPVSIQIAMALGIQPLALLVPEVLGSNVIGISTLIGTPTNILIGSAGKISFSDFLINLTPGVLIAMVGLIIYCEWIYWKELRAATHPSPTLLEMLEENARITEPDNLKKAGVVGAFMLVLFATGEFFHLVPSVTALMGATALLLWIGPDIEEMIEAVDWTTLVFFIGLFVVVGAIQEVGLVDLIAQGIGRVVGENLVLTTMAVIWSSALLSTVIANIPFTAAMLPVIGFLSGSVPGATDKVLYYSLSVGSAMGGNGSLIGASANLVTAGIAERAGYPITYMYFLKRGLPALLITVSLATVWIYFHFLP